MGAPSTINIINVLLIVQVGVQNRLPLFWFVTADSYMIVSIHSGALTDVDPKLLDNPYCGDPPNRYPSFWETLMPRPNPRKPPCNPSVHCLFHLILHYYALHTLKSCNLPNFGTSAIIYHNEPYHILQHTIMNYDKLYESSQDRAGAGFSSWLSRCVSDSCRRWQCS